jgi:hypothetical protein
MARLRRNTVDAPSHPESEPTRRSLLFSDFEPRTAGWPRADRLDAFSFGVEHGASISRDSARQRESHLACASGAPAVSGEPTNEEKGSDAACHSRAARRKLTREPSVGVVKSAEYFGSAGPAHRAVLVTIGLSARLPSRPHKRARPLVHDSVSCLYGVHTGQHEPQNPRRVCL